MSVCVIEPALVGRNLRQGPVDIEQLTAPVGRGRNPSGCLEVVDGLLRLALGVVYLTKEPMKLADPELVAFIQEETENLGCGFFCGVELVVVVQQPSELFQRL